MITRFIFICIALCVLCSAAQGRAAAVQGQGERKESGTRRRTRLFRRIHRRRGVHSDGRRLWGFVKKAGNSIAHAAESAGKSIAHAATSLTKKSTWDSAGKAISSAAKTVAKTATTVADGAVKGAEDVVTVPLAGAAALAKVAGAK